MKIPLQVTEAIPPRRLVTRIADPNLPWGGTWTTEITPAPGGSVMRITEDGYVNNPLFRFHGSLRFRLHQHPRLLHEIIRRKVRRASHTSKLDAGHRLPDLHNLLLKISPPNMLASMMLLWRLR